METITTKNAFEGVKVKPNDMVEIEYTKDLKSNGTVFIKAGTKSSVHSVQADKLIAHGKAILAGSAKPKGGK